MGKQFVSPRQITVLDDWHNALIDDHDKFIDHSISTISSSLLISAKNGDQQSWLELVQIFGRVVYAWIRSKGVPESDAADIRQQVFTSVYQAIDRFQRETKADTFRGWLRKITHNKIVDYWRKRGRIPEQINENQLEIVLNQISIEEHPDGQSSMISEQDEQKEILKELLRFVKTKIRDDHWEIFEKIIKGDDNRENIADAHNISRAYVDVVFSRVMAKLRAQFPDYPTAE